MKVYKALEDGIRIIEYEDSVAGALAEMWRQSADSWGGGGELRTAEDIIAEHSSGSFFNVFVAMKGEEAVGYCSFDRYYKDADTAYVHVLNVRPDYHGKKVGKELVLQCVSKTIELGYPRVDIHTWAGNTKAVPLYKKCGFLWEDRADSTHLQNQIPTVLKTELFAGFFTTADWYNDSNRVIEIKPDGVKQNGFEVFGYSWHKDGRNLQVGFERTGRRVRLAETDDYRIEMTAEHHELAFGLSYKCSFRADNKSGAPLHIAIKGKHDGVISFDFAAEADITDSKTFEAQFSVGEIVEEQDIWRMHPCVLADVTVNGKSAEFGLGIEPRFPLTVSLIEKRQLPRAGASEDVYINIESSLPLGARVTFTLPQNTLLSYAADRFETDIDARAKACVATKAVIAGYGYAALPVSYDIALADGRSVRFTKPLHIVNQGPGAAFAFETQDSYGAVNGLWKVNVNKQNNNAGFAHTSGMLAGITVAKLGKPYDDEFNLLKPCALRFSAECGIARLEADFVSHKFAGTVMTTVYALDGAGVLWLSYRVTNTSERASSFRLKANVYLQSAHRPVYRYGGGFHGVADDLAYGFSNIHPEKLEENWIFNGDAKRPTGVYWPTDVRPQPHRGDELMFEYGEGDLSPGGRFETEPVVFMSGAFERASDFRNYVLGLDEPSAPHVHNHLETEANGFNPVLASGDLEVAALNHRPRTMEGSLTLSSCDSLFPPVSAQADGVWERIAQRVPITPAFSGVTTAKLSLRFMGFEKDIERTVFVAGGPAVTVVEKGGSFTASSGDLSFSASADFCGTMHSLTYQGREWLYSQYPALKPYAWWNPFIGGVAAWLPKMNANLTLREKRQARPAEMRDCFGNIWTGIATRVDVEKYDEHKGVAYEQYFLTLPGVPVVCHFVKLINFSGIYKKLGMSGETFVSGKEGLSSVFAAFRGCDAASYRLRAGKEDFWQRLGALAVFSREGANARDEKLYVYRDSQRDSNENYLRMDVSTVSFNTWASLSVEHGGSAAARPIFYIITPKTLTEESLADLSRVRF